MHDDLTYRVIDKPSGNVIAAFRFFIDMRNFAREFESAMYKITEQFWVFNTEQWEDVT